jgi:hypothetical protein
VDARGTGMIRTFCARGDDLRSVMIAGFDEVERRVHRGQPNDAIAPAGATDRVKEVQE